MKKIKWENIAFVLVLVYGVVCIMHHSRNEISYMELPIYFGQALLVRYSVKYIRNNTKAFLSEISDLISE